MGLVCQPLNGVEDSDMKEMLKTGQAGWQHNSTGQIVKDHGSNHLSIWKGTT